MVSIPNAYASILFIRGPVNGLIILLSTLIYPNIGLAGLIAALTAFTITRLWRLPDYASQTQIFNSLLVGLSLGAFYKINLYLIIFIILAVFLAVLIATLLSDWLWRLDKLPAFSLPFVLVTGITALAARQYTETNDFLGLTETLIDLFPTFSEPFLKSLGAIYFTPEPLTGFILFVLLTLYSRYLSMLAILGYLTGHLLLTQLLYEPHQGFIIWTSFNFILVAIALGGIFTVPGLISLLIALVGVLLSTLLVVASRNLILVEGLPVMAISFVTVTLLMLATMKKRIGILKPYLAPDPGRPETNYEKARLAKYRNGELNSVPLLAPFNGNWTIYQGFNGEHTHVAPWQYALDFIITNDGLSYHDNGDSVEDYFCFNAPVLSPAKGEVVRCYDRFDDNEPGETDTKNNWGNFILIRLESGLHLLLAHLKKSSIKVHEGQQVNPGKVLAACGNSGRSPQPHLHLQVQERAELGSPSYPFHLCSIMSFNENSNPQYKVVSVPEKGEIIAPARADDKLSMPLHLPVGRELCYQLISTKTGQTFNHCLTVKLTLLGQYRLQGESGGSIAFAEKNGVLAFYDRKDNRDVLLDIWALANGLTPLTEDAHRWQDAPSAFLLPLSKFEKFWLNIIRPLGCGASTEYQRHWDNENNVWVQKGLHQLKIAALDKTVETTSVIDPLSGCRDLYLNDGDTSWHATLTTTGIIEDEGIPRWTQQYGNNANEEH